MSEDIDEYIERSIHNLNVRQQKIIKMLEDIAVRQVMIEKRIRSIEVIIAQRRNYGKT